MTFWGASGSALVLGPIITRPGPRPSGVLCWVPHEGGALESGWTEQVLFPPVPSPGLVFSPEVFPVLHLPVRVVPRT